MSSPEVPKLNLHIDTHDDTVVPKEAPQMSMDEFVYTRSKMDELFLQWLSQKDTANLVRSLLQDIEQGKEVHTPPIPGILANCFSTDPSARRVRETYSHGSSLPRSPVSRPIGGSTSPQRRSSPRSPIAPRRPLAPSLSPSRSNTTTPSSSDEASHVPATQRKALPLPKFFTPGQGGRGRGKRVARDQLEVCEQELEKLWDACNDGTVNATPESFVELTKRCGLPGFFNRPLMLRISEMFPSNAAPGGYISKQQFLQYWRREVAPFDVCERTFRLIKQPGASTIDRTDFLPFIEELLLFHPGLQFLDGHAEFQEKYARTVATRILYSVNTSRTGRISLREFRRSDLLSAFRLVEAETDINRITLYFSYEHFYVLFCRFWELDTDHDGAISREDLLRYGDHRLSMAIVDRIFSVGARPSCDGAGAQGRASVMYFEDFIYFMLSEEDKGTKCSLQYWFECVDFDGDGIITPSDMRLFYDVQAQRMESLGHDVVPFADVLCQMSDMIKPEIVGQIVLTDLLRSDIIHVAGTIFDALFNLDKFIQFEQRDPFAERQKRDDPFECDWDRFAYNEYNRLAQEEEEREKMDLDGGMDEYDEYGSPRSNEAPF